MSKIENFELFGTSIIVTFKYGTVLISYIVQFFQIICVIGSTDFL